MLIALLSIKVMATSDTSDCSIFNTLAHLVSGKVSVGLKGMLVVKAMKR
jgi:hypothetical protein